MASEWRAAPLVELIEFTRDGEWGSDSPSPETVEMLVVRGTDFERLRIGALDGIPRRYVKKDVAEKKRLRIGDVLIETAGGTREQPTGRTALVMQRHIDKISLPVTCASFARFMRLRPTVDSRFIYWWLQNLHRSGEMEKHQVQHTGIARFQFTKFAATTKAPLPPVSEQCAIADALSMLDDKIELNRRMNETLEAMARALFKSWFVDCDPVRAKVEGRDPGLPAHIADMFPDRFTDSELGKIPEGWPPAAIGDLAEIVGGSTPSTTEPAFWNGEHHWATPKDLAGLSAPVLLETERKITDAGLGQISSGLLPPGTVLLSSRAPIGYLAITHIPVAINQGFVAMKPRDGVPNSFLLLWAEEAKDEIISRANGSTFLEISRASFRSIPVVRPAATALARFNAIAGPLLSRVAVNERESRTLAAIRDALLPKLISGEIRVKEAERLVAEAAG